MTDGALAGLRVLDLSQGVAGPYCTKLLADYGADVIKVERLGSGDPARSAGPFPDDAPDLEKSALFLHLNTNKRSITLDLKHPRGVGVLRRLAVGSDVVVESFRPGTLARLGLPYEELVRLSPTAVLTSVSNFGQTGPYRDHEATDLILWALSSRMSLAGAAGRPPLTYAGNTGQYFAGNHAAVATMGAVLGARLHRTGQWIDVSIHEALAGAVDSRLLFYEYTKDVPHRSTAMAYPQPAADGYAQMAMQIVADGTWRSFVELIGRPEFLDDPRFATGPLRAQHLAELQQALREWLSVRGKREAAAAAQQLRITAAPVLTVSEVATDPHHNARGFFVDVAHPFAGTLRYPGAPFVLQEGAWAIRRPAPLLGEHTAEVLQERLGLRQDEIAGLRADRVV